MEKERDGILSVVLATTGDGEIFTSTTPRIFS
jgi:hypothetical protein